LKSARFIIRGIDVLSEYSGKIVSFLIFPVVVIVAYEVTSRYAFDAPTIWAHESIQLIYGLYGVLAGAYCLYHRSHVNVELFYERFSLRTKAVLDIVTSPLFFMFCGVLVFYGMGFGLRSLSIWEHSGSAWAPIIWPVKLAIPLGALLLTFQGLAKFIRDLYIVATGRQMT